MSARDRRAFTLAEDDRSPRHRRVGRWFLLGLIVIVGIGGWIGAQRVLDSFRPRECEVRAAGQSYTWAPDQASNTAVITAIAMKRGMVPRAATIAIATAMQESKVRNITYGDRDSVGLFQQRPSQGWGTVEQIMNPEYSSNAFYDALEKVSGWETADIAQAAQAVQRSADGSFYAQHEGKARATASVLSGNSPAGIGCRLDAPTAAGDPAALVALVKSDHNLDAHASGRSVIVDVADARQAWMIGSWGVARAIDTGVLSVTVGDQQWTRSTSGDALQWSPATTAQPATRVVLTL